MINQYYRLNGFNASSKRRGLGFKSCHGHLFFLAFWKGVRVILVE